MGVLPIGLWYELLVFCCDWGWDGIKFIVDCWGVIGRIGGVIGRDGVES